MQAGESPLKGIHTRGGDAAPRWLIAAPQAAQPQGAPSLSTLLLPRQTFGPWTLRSEAEHWLANCPEPEGHREGWLRKGGSRGWPVGPWAPAPGHFNQRSSVGSMSWVSSSINRKHFFLEQLTSFEPPTASLRLANKSLGRCHCPRPDAQGSSCPPVPAPVCLLLVRSRKESPAFSKAPSILLKGLRLREWKLNYGKRHSSQPCICGLRFIPLRGILYIEGPLKIYFFRKSHSFARQKERESPAPERCTEGGCQERGCRAGSPLPPRLLG